MENKGKKEKKEKETDKKEEKVKEEDKGKEGEVDGNGTSLKFTIFILVGYCNHL